MEKELTSGRSSETESNELLMSARKRAARKITAIEWEDRKSHVSPCDGT
jgi:hypothetical protein